MKSQTVLPINLARSLHSMILKKSVLKKYKLKNQKQIVCKAHILVSMFILFQNTKYTSEVDNLFLTQSMTHLSRGQFNLANGLCNSYTMVLRDYW